MFREFFIITLGCHAAKLKKNAPAVTFDSWLCNTPVRLIVCSQLFELALQLSIQRTLQSSVSRPICSVCRRSTLLYAVPEHVIPLLRHESADATLCARARVTSLLLLRTTLRLVSLRRLICH